MLRVLGLAYLASASAFAMAATFAAHPALAPFLEESTQVAGRNFREMVWEPALDFVRREHAAVFHGPVKSIAIVPPRPGELRTVAHSTVPSIAARKLTARAQPQFAARFDDIIAPDLPPADVAAPPSHSAPPPVRDAILAANERAAMLRLKDSLTPQMLKSFDLFLYVSKADSGPLAQRMYVFRKQPDNRLKLAYDWAASTGREQAEVSPLGRREFTDTPRGYYQLDPHRMYWRYHSHAWNQPMPYSMFFNWEREGLATGLAIHGASGDDIGRLGHRASAGCVHIAPQNAWLLYHLIRANYKGQVPRFSYDARTRTMSSNGDFQHDADGRLAMAEGYKVLIFIEDYGGNAVEALF